MDEIKEWRRKEKREGNKATWRADDRRNKYVCIKRYKKCWTTWRKTKKKQKVKKIHQERNKIKNDRKKNKMR